MAERLYRSRDDRMLAGVAGGVAETLDADPSIVRVVWAVLAIVTGGLAIVVYIVMAIVVPEAPTSSSTPPDGGITSPPAGGFTSPPDPEARREARRARRGGSADASRAGLVGGLVLIVIGAIFLIREVIPSFDWDLWWPIGLILLGGLLLVLALIPGRSPD